MHATRPVLTFNGVNGATGAYLLPELAPGDLFSFARGEALDRDHLYDLKLRLRQESGTSRAVKEGVDPLLLSQAGWGVIFAFEEQDQAPALREALAALLSLRRDQAGERYKEFTCRPGESKTAFLARHGAGPGPADPDKVPYYLLIVASPQAIPFDFQYQLDVQYAVGRLYFDSLEGYAAYARGVVAMESGEAALPRQVAFFSAQNDDDRATQLSTTQLVAPLAQKLAADPASAGWELRSLTGEGATKAALAGHLGGDQTPALLFTASHGMGFPKDDPRQLPHQGALLCQDWPGPYAWKEPIPEAHYFSADDVSSDAHLGGGMSFHYACYGAGTPLLDDFAHRLSRQPAAIAAQPFVARLPQRLLAHPRGGLLAVVGHVERAWGYSFVWQNAGSQLAVFESALKRLMAGYPVGYAMEYFNARYAELSTVISSEMLGAQFGKLIDEVELAGMWTANNDARSYVILGDPAVRLRLRPQGRSSDEIPAASPVTLQAGTPSPEGFPAQLPGDLSPNERQGALELVVQALLELPPEGGDLPKAESLVRLGDLLAGSQSGDRLTNLQAAIQAYQAALKHLPGQEGALLSRLGAQYAGLYALTGEGEHARQAEAAFKRLQGTLHGPALPNVLFDLACLYARLYRQEKDTSHAQMSMENFRAALEGVRRETAPYRWATIHFELGRIEGELFIASGDERCRAGAVEDLQAALQVFTLDLFPYQHAQAQRMLADLVG